MKVAHKKAKRSRRNAEDDEKCANVQKRMRKYSLSIEVELFEQLRGHSFHARSCMNRVIETALVQYFDRQVA